MERLKKSMRYLNYILLLSFSLVLTSCIDQLNVNLSESDNEYLIIEGQLRDNETRHNISIKLNSPESTDFQADLPINEAEVYVLKNQTERFDFLNNNELGQYLNYDLRMDLGDHFQLYVIYQGISYTSQSETLLSAVPMLETKTILTSQPVNNEAQNIVDAAFVNIFANSQLPVEEEVYLKYNVKGVFEYREIASRSNPNASFCYVDEIIGLDNISLATNESLPEGFLENQFIFQKLVDYRFSTQYCMKVYQERISKNAYEFWRLVENEYSRSGDIFEKPPGIIRGNITESEETEISAVGLFSVIAVDSLLHLIIPKDVDSPAPECQPYPVGPPSCMNCLLLPKSTLNKPECFI